MRKVMDEQVKFGEVNISEIKFDMRCRDEIPKLLLGLQHIYCTPEIRSQVFKVLEKIVPESVSPDTGRTGMELWKILVLGTLRLNCNWDYDKLQEIVNNHRTLRQMLGHGVFDWDAYYARQTLKDNVSLLTAEILDEINQIVVHTGHRLLKKKDEDIKARCDSFVVETDVHYPTDTNILFDSMRKLITATARVCEVINWSGWRQYKHNLRKIKKLYRKTQRLKRSNSKDSEKKMEREKVILAAYAEYIDVAWSFVVRSRNTLEGLLRRGSISGYRVHEIMDYLRHAERQIDQIRRRALLGERIPHEEKVFSIFEEYTEWLCKGKAGVPQELGLLVCVVEDTDGFLLHHRVLEKETDEKVAVPIIRESKERFKHLSRCSFDKGFYSPVNKRELEEILDVVALPKKGRLSVKDQELEYSQEFIRSRRQHSAVESAINALENHGLDRCLDHGITGFRRYVALAVVARNLQIMGNIIQQKELKRREKAVRRQRKYRIAA